MHLKSKRVVFWGTYDKGKPRVRLLLAGARAMGIDVLECHTEIWEGVEDKSQLFGIKTIGRRILSIFVAYPVLIYKYLQLPPHDFIVVAYMGQFDVLVIWLFARLRNVPICWDVFISLYDTVVNDRKIVSQKSMAAMMLYFLEWLSSRAANQLFIDTRTHAKYFEELYHLRKNSVSHIYVGAESNIFKKERIIQKPRDVFTVLFYGQFIPLHGINTIVHAARIIEESGEKIRWIIIGKGQEEPLIDSFIKETGIKSIQRISWVNYKELIDYIGMADICLGIFGVSGKATRVIPNKVYQILSAGKPLITGDTPAIRELLNEGPTIRLVTPGDPRVLASEVLDLRKDIETIIGKSVIPYNFPIVGPVDVGKQFVEVLKKCKR